MPSSRIDGISLAGMMQRWEVFEQHLPKVEGISPEIHTKNAASRENHRPTVRATNVERK
jgi:hypothetical protein